MNEMIERVARAIFFRGGEQDDMQWKHGQSYLRDIAIEQARAAIEAMREPTRDMLSAGAFAGPFTADRWRAMIDAILSPTRGE